MLFKCINKKGRALRANNTFNLIPSELSFQFFSSSIPKPSLTMEISTTHDLILLCNNPNLNK